LREMLNKSIVIYVDNRLDKSVVLQSVSSRSISVMKNIVGVKEET
jgi:hypothetical protein